MIRRTGQLLVLVAAGLVCTSEPDLGTPEVDAAAVALVQAHAWGPTPTANDPLLSHRPMDTACEPDAWHEEIGGIELDTGKCNYLALSQPASVDVAAGDELELAMWWQPLISVEPATAHVAVLAGHDLLWEESIPVPSEADVRELSFEAPHDIPAGTPLHLHLHNHGANTWHFHHLLVHSHHVP